MNKSKLVQLIRHLSENQKDKFIRYLNSPYFVSSYEDVQQRMTIFTKYLYEESSHDQSTISLQKMNVWIKLFGNKPYNDTRMRQEMTHLTKELERFLTFEAVQKSKEYMEVSLLKYYSDYQDLRPLFKSTLAKVQKQLETEYNHKEDATRYFHLFNLQRTISYFNSWDLPKGVNEDNLQNTIFSLDIYYIVSKLKYACLWANYFQKNEVLSPIDDSIILKISNNQYLSDFPIITIYRYALLILKNELEDIQEVDKFIQLLKKHLSEFSSKEGKSLFTYAYNYLIIKLRQTHDENLSIQLMLYELKFGQRMRTQVP